MNPIHPVRGTDRFAKFVALAVFLVASCAAGIGPVKADDVCEGEVADWKSNPGHYVSVKRGAPQAEIVGALQTGVAGIQKRYYWADLETEENSYDFSPIAADLNLASENNVQLVAFIVDKTFKPEMPVPQYLESYTAKNRKDGYTLIRWQPRATERLQALLQAVGNEFDCHPNFEGVAIQESAPSLEDDVLADTAYTPEKYRDALIQILLSGAEAMPNSSVFWYMNFLPGKQAYLGDVAEALIGTNMVMGGPDVLPNNNSLTRRVYPFYNQFQGKIPLFGSMQFDSYAHPHASGSHATKFWTMQEMFDYARDQLHVNYLFWNLKTWRKPKDSYDWEDALPVIAENSAFAEE